MVTNSDVAKLSVQESAQEQSATEGETDSVGPSGIFSHRLHVRRVCKLILKKKFNLAPDQPIENAIGDSRIVFELKSEAENDSEQVSHCRPEEPEKGF